jgi:hypothetical protein
LHRERAGKQIKKGAIDAVLEREEDNFIFSAYLRLCRLPCP